MKSIDNLRAGDISREMRMRFIGFISILVTVVYGNTALNGYSVDDNLIVDGNEQAEAGFEGISDILTTNYFSRGEKRGSYRAIPRASFAIEIGLFGKKPGVSHVINVFLFLFTCILILRLLTLLFPRRNTVAILFAVVLFVLHPLHTEVVASLKNRDELMQLLFSLLASVSIIEFVRNGKVFHVFLSSFYFLIALSCKESAVQFLAIYPVLFYYAGDVNRNRALMASASMLSIVVGFGVFQVFVLNPDAVMWMDTAKDEFPFIEHPLMHTEEFSLKYGTAFYGLGYYLKLFLVPHPLGFFYGYNQLPIVPIYNLFSIISIIVYGGLSLLALRGLKSRSFLSLGIIIMLICLAIFSNLIIQVSGIVAERFAYSSSLGFCLMAGWFVQVSYNRVSHIGKTGIALASAVLFILFGFLTIERNTNWKNYLTLASHDAEVFSESAIVHFYLGLYIENRVLDTATVNQEDWWRKAAHEYAQVSRIHPASYVSSLYSANIYGNELSNLDSAIIMYEKLFDASPKYKHLDALHSYGICLKEKGRTDEAIGVFQEGVLHHPADLLSHKYLAELLFMKKKMDALNNLLNQIENRFPTSDIASVYRGNLALQKNDQISATNHFEKAIYLNPDNQVMATFLIGLYENLGMLEKAQILRNKLNLN
ncbi:MAG: tetratricopeptide (TPR) repeat protein [Bacteroidia bacterium]|jgi:tetratricopeptide (TPR) repeat protein